MSKCSSLTLWNLQLYNNSFEWKNVTFSGGQNILWPLHIFRGSGPNPPRSTPLVARTGTITVIIFCGRKVPENFRSGELKFLGMNIPQTKVPNTFAPRTENTGREKSCYHYTEIDGSLSTRGHDMWLAKESSRYDLRTSFFYFKNCKHVEWQQDCKWFHHLGIM